MRLKTISLIKKYLNLITLKSL